MREATQWRFAEGVAVMDAGLFVVILIGLLLQRRELYRPGSVDASSWSAAEEIRPTPKEILQVRAVAAWRTVGMVVAGLAVLLLPWLTGPGATNLAAFAAINAIVLLSLVVLTGWTGQISLGQYSFVAIGAVLGGALSSKLGLPFWIVIPLAGIATAGFAFLVGLPALRIRGLFLAIATFAMAYALELTLFREELFGWLLPERVERPTFFLLDLEDERTMYYVTVAVLVVCAAGVSVLRRSRTGRVFIGVRENEAHVQSFAVRVVRTRLSAFSLAGFLCGLAGALLAYHQRAVSPGPFSAMASLEIFLLGVVGGISSVTGALLGATYYAARQLLSGDAAFIAGPLAVALLLYLTPKGLAGLVYSARDAIYRIIALRHQIDVPSLVSRPGDELLTGRYIPLIPPGVDSALTEVVKDPRYGPSAPLYARRGLSIQPRVRSAGLEKSAFNAAAGGFSANGHEPDAPSLNGAAQSASVVVAPVPENHNSNPESV